MLKAFLSSLLVSPTMLSKDSEPGNQIFCLLFHFCFYWMQDETIDWFKLVNKFDLYSKS